MGFIFDNQVICGEIQTSPNIRHVRRLLNQLVARRQTGYSLVGQIPYGGTHTSKNTSPGQGFSFPLVSATARALISSNLRRRARGSTSPLPDTQAADGGGGGRDLGAQTLTNSICQDIFSQRGDIPTDGGPSYLSWSSGLWSFFNSFIRMDSMEPWRIFLLSPWVVRLVFLAVHSC